MSITVLDVSNYQPTVDWAKAKSAIQAVYVKATEGIGYVSPSFVSQVDGASAVGLPVGVYHFGHPNNDPTAEANHFVGIIKPHLSKLSLMPVLDLEVEEGTSAHIEQWANTFMDAVASATGRKVMLYTGAYYINNHGLSSLTTHPLWVAAYQSTPPSVGAFPGYLMWQRTSSGAIPGYSGSVDLSVAPSVSALQGNFTASDISKGASPMLQEGSTGSAVKTLQEDLLVLGYSIVGTADGDFGQHTKDAVIKFQEDNHLTPDGIVGPATQAEVDKVYQAHVAALQARKPATPPTPPQQAQTVAPATPAPSAKAPETTAPAQPVAPPVLVDVSVAPSLHALYLEMAKIFGGK